MLKSILPVRSAPANPQTNLVRLNVAAKAIGCSTSTLRRLCNTGELPCHRSPIGAQRYVDVAQAAEIFGLNLSPPEPEETSASFIVGYCRVSTSKQKLAGSLDRQAERVRSHIEANWPGERFVLLSEQASGINASRRQLLRLLDMALAGKVCRVVVEWQDRLSRGSYVLISRLLEKCGVEIVLTKTGERENDAKTQEEETLHDAMSMIYCMQARACGRRAHDKTRFVPSQAFRDRVAGLAAQGLSRAAIWFAINGEGHTCQNTGKPATLASIKNVLYEIRRAVGSTMTTTNVVPESVHRFIKEQCSIGAGKETFTRELWAGYVAFCQSKHGAIYAPVSRKKLSGFVRLIVPNASMERSGHHGNEFVVRGLSLRSNA